MSIDYSYGVKLLTCRFFRTFPGACVVGFVRVEFAGAGSTFSRNDLFGVAVGLSHPGAANAMQTPTTNPLRANCLILLSRFVEAQGA